MRSDPMASSGSDKVQNGENIWGVVVAAGSGTRFGSPKHLIELAGRPLWRWARDALLESGAREVVVVGQVAGGVEGGTERHRSVARGIENVDSSATVIAVHDAARPLASVDLIKRMYRRMAESGEDGVVPVIPIVDALKKIHPGTDRLAGTVDRQEIVAVQTPQVFRAEMLRKAHAHPVSGLPPDDATLVEAIGGRIGTVPGERSAFKITYPEDLTMAEALVEAGMVRGKS
ncbi:MAG: IspD/TarI family cytidylyltransferase [bacterium]|nr:IspD/TarI family cytidylyltransferase [bacterium]